MENLRKKILLEILSSLRDIWDWAPILETNIENGNFGEGEIEEIENFLKKKALNGKIKIEREIIEQLQEKITHYRVLEENEKMNDTQQAESTLSFFS